VLEKHVPFAALFNYKMKLFGCGFHGKFVAWQFNVIWGAAEIKKGSQKIHPMI